ncbi:MAG: carboxypeptidase-like regulatory domain-containing protein [Salinivirgaceae bacterium]
MNKRLFQLLILLLAFNFINAQNGPNMKVSCNFEAISFQSFIDYIEKESDIHFYYRQEWINTINITIKGDSLTIPQLIDATFRKTSLNYTLVNSKDIYIIPDKNFISDLPEYNAELKQQANESANNESQFPIKDTYLKGREPNMIATIVVGSKNSSRNGKYALVTAKILEKKTGESVIGATLYIRELKKGAATDVNGKLSLAMLPGKYTAEFQSVGMLEVRCILDVQSDGTFELLMEEKITSLDEVIISAEESSQRGSKIGLEKISIKSVKEIPTFMGEKDVIKISQMLPGVVSVGEGSSGVNVRGGNTDQNLFYLNNIPIYNTSHVFGFFSAINSTIVNNFSLYKGYIPAEYGGRLSSVFVLDSRKGSKSKFFTQGGIGVVSANIEVEVPIVKKKCSVLLSARSSYSDWVLNRLEDPALRNSSVQFSDFTGSVDYEIDKKNKLTAFGYFSSDYFDYNKLNTYNYSNAGGSLNYMHRFNNSLKGTLVLINSNYRYNTTDNSFPNEAYQQQYQLNHSEIKGIFDWVINNNQNINFGVDVINYRLDRGTIEPYGLESIKKPIDLGKEQGLESSIFIEDKFQVFPWLNFTGGFHLSSFMEYGPGTIYNYAPDMARETNNIIDTVDYNSGSKIASYYHPQFRFAAEFKIDPFHSIKLSFNQMQQYLFMLSNTISIAPNDQWKLVDYHIQPPVSNQASIGLYKIFPSLGLSSSAETYFKRSKHVVEYKDGIDFLSTPNVETTILQGDQDAYGVELMLSKEEGNFTGWVTYTYSRSLITVDGTNAWDKINLGKTYPSNYDKPHVCNLILNYHFNRRFSISSNVVYTTGRPITLPQGLYYMDGQPYVDYSMRNEYRIPDYFRLDVSAILEGNLRLKKPFHSYWMFSIYNLTGRNNAQSVYFRSEDGRINGYKYSVIGEAIFTISWNFKLGNFSNN